jgi:hypothetical protein
MEWVFFRNLSGQWCWECRANHRALKESRRAFSTRRDCVADAMRYGFVAGPLAGIAPVVKSPRPTEAVS